MFNKCNTHAGLPGPAIFWMFAPLVALTVCLNTASAQAVQLPVIDMTVGSHPITAEVAATNQSRSYGLMNRPSLAVDSGMLFVFQNTGQPCFWMKNTPLPLSIAFIDPDGIIVNMADMQPYSHISHCPHGPVLYALEMEQGWFKSKGIQPGARVAPLPQP